MAETVPPRRGRSRGVYLLPNLFTTSALFAGFYSVIASYNGDYRPAAIAIIAAMVLDGFDGRVARMTGTSTAFGAEYDSMADMISSGLAPAFLAYAWALSSLTAADYGQLGWVVAFVYTACCGLRLARFNVAVGTADKRFFQGLACPSPAALAAWLPDQPLAPFVWKARRLTRIGRDDAPLLVVVEREPSASLPLEGEAAELFERMLGAIGRTRRDTCQCVLSGTPEPGGDTVAALAGTARPITLVLVRELDGALDADGCRLPGEPFGGAAWCLPHPDLLLAEPAAKRQAWRVLKAVRQHLPLLP